MSTTREPPLKTDSLWRKCWSSYLAWTENVPWLNKYVSLSHRPWIITLAFILLILVILPSPQSNQEAIEKNKEHQIYSTPNSAQLTETIQSQPVLPPEYTTTNIEEWQDLQLQSGQSIAQLFRDNNLPVNDAFALANAEGDTPQLHNLPAGQLIRIKLAKNGTIVAVDIRLANHEQIFFVRQPDGTFLML